MEKKSSKVKVIIFTALVMIAFLLLITVGQYIVMFPDMMKIIMEENVSNATDIMKKLAEKDGLIANAQFVGELLTVTVMGLWYYFGYVKKEKKSKVYKPVTEKFKNKYNLIFVILLILTASFSLFTVYSVLQVVIPEQVEAMNGFLGGIGDNWLGLVAVIIGAPLSEEFAMRGIIMKKSKKAFGLVGCMLISGICFGLLHANLVQGLYALPLGMIYGYIAYRFNSVIPTIIGHAFHNGLGGRIFEVLGPVGVVIGLIVCSIALFFVSKKVELPMEDQRANDIDVDDMSENIFAEE